MRAPEVTENILLTVMKGDGISGLSKNISLPEAFLLFEASVS